MGTCQPQNQNDNDNPSPTIPELPATETPIKVSSNPFYDIAAKNSNQYNILSKYSFHSKYTDQFLGEVSVLEQKSSGDIFLCKELSFSNQAITKQQFAELQARKNKLTCQNVIQIKEVLIKKTDGFFGETQKIYIIIDYPFINFQRQIANRLIKKISFTKQQILNFLSSTIKGYSRIQKAGYLTDKVRLKNIFIGIKSKSPVIKVAESSLIQPKSNYKYMIQGGPSKLSNRDIYLSPQQYLAWCDHNASYIPANKKSGVFSLGMCLLDVCIMDPSREVYHFTEKKIDNTEISNRIEIAGKKYGGSLQKMLKQMLENDPQKRISFCQLEEQIPNLYKNGNQITRMRLSVIPTQKSNILHNDNSDLKSSAMFKSVLSNSNNSNSRVFASGIKAEKSRINQEETIKITEHYTNGNKYSGEKRGKCRHGKGRYDLADGSYYQGQWSQNKINGVGKLFFKNGKIQYEGEWRNDLFHGWGTLHSEASNWIKYEGQFKNGVKEGRGRMYFQDGSIYDGEFKGDKILGRGRKISQNGQVCEKYWDAISPQRFS